MRVALASTRARRRERNQAFLPRIRENANMLATDKDVLLGAPVTHPFEQQLKNASGSLEMKQQCFNRGSWRLRAESPEAARGGEGYVFSEKPQPNVWKGIAWWYECPVRGRREERRVLLRVQNRFVGRAQLFLPAGFATHLLQRLYRNHPYVFAHRSPVSVAAMYSTQLDTRATFVCSIIWTS